MLVASVYIITVLIFLTQTRNESYNHWIDFILFTASKNNFWITFNHFDYIDSVSLDNMLYLYLYVYIFLSQWFGDGTMLAKGRIDFFLRSYTIS